jgi:hypothetical protein
VTNTYLPFYRRKWKRSTALCNEDRLHVHLEPIYSERTLGSFNREELQTMLDEKAASEVDPVFWTKSDPVLDGVAA